MAWRTGRKVGRTIYAGDLLIGLMDTPGQARRVVDAVNAFERVEGLGLGELAYAGYFKACGGKSLKHPDEELPSWDEQSPEIQAAWEASAAAVAGRSVMGGS